MRTVPLGAIVRDARPGFASGAEAPDGIVQIRMNNVTTDGALDWSKLRRVPEPKNVAELIVEPNDILLNATNSPDLVGKNAVFKDFPEPVTFSNHFIRLRLDDRVADSRLISRWLTDQWQRRKFKSMCRQWVNQASLNKGQFLNLLIPLPPLSEQRRIAAILDQADDLRRKRREAMERVSAFVEASLRESFGDPISNSRGFPTARLEQLVDPTCPITYGILMPGPHVDDGVPYIRVIDIQAGAIVADSIRNTSSTIASQYKRSELVGGDVLISIRGHVGRLAVVPNELTGANVTQDTAPLAITGAEPTLSRRY
jgi:type I restriction enzyme S subunit